MTSEQIKLEVLIKDLIKKADDICWFLMVDRLLHRALEETCIKDVQELTGLIMHDVLPFFETKGR